MLVGGGGRAEGEQSLPALVFGFGQGKFGYGRDRLLELVGENPLAARCVVGSIPAGPVPAVLLRWGRVTSVLNRSVELVNNSAGPPTFGLARYNDLRIHGWV